MDVIEHKAKRMLKSTAEQESKKGLSMTVYLRKQQCYSIH